MIFRSTLTSRRTISSIPSSIRWASTSTSSPPPGPTFQSRTSPRDPATAGQHPGYTSYNTPPQSSDPKDMPGVEAGAIPHGSAPSASTKPGSPHPEVHAMAKGAEEGGSDAITPEEKNVKNWGPNSRSADFNQHEQKRNPILHGGSHEGGKLPDGSSRT